MKTESDNERWPDAGTPTYVISIKWLAKFQDYIFWDAINYGRKPEPDEDHISKMHPGKITNADVLHLEDKYLKGTGKLKGFPAELYDTFIHTDVREKKDYEFITEQLWCWLKEHYEADHEVKRLYVKQNTKFIYSSMTSVESRFKLVPVMLVKGEDIISGKVQ